MVPLTYAQYSNMTTCLSGIGFDKKQRFISLEITLEIPDELKSNFQDVKIGFKTYLTNRIEKEMGRAVKVTLGSKIEHRDILVFGIELNPNESNPLKKLKSLSTILKALLKANLISSNDAILLVQEFITTNIPEYETQNFTVQVENNCLAISKTPKSLFELTAKKALFFFSQQRIKKENLKILPAELTKMFAEIYPNQS